MNRAHLAAASLLTLTLYAAGAQAQVSTTTASAVHAGTYAVEPSHTRVLFSVNHMGFTNWYGDFTGVSGTLTLNPHKPAASAVHISIPAASVTTTNAKLDGELKSADWLNAASYPTIDFTSTSIKPTGPGTANITGNLTLHGVTHTIVLAAHFNGAGVNPLDHAYTTGFDATTHLHRSDYGVRQYVPLVGDSVTVTISAAFEQK